MKSKLQSVQCFMKKIRSKLPRRRRSQISPILCSSPALIVAVVSDSNASSYLTREVSCDSSRVSVNKRKPEAVAVKKRGSDETSAGDGEFRRITRSYVRKRENERVVKKKEEFEREVELSESSCVESCSGVVAEERSSKLSRRIAGDGAEITKEVRGIGKSDGDSRSEVSCVQQFSRTRSDKISSGAEISLDNRENDVISVHSQLKSPSELKFGSILSYINKLSDRTITGVENGVSGDDVPKAPNSAESEFSESTTEKKPNLISADFDLACSEHLSGEEISTYSPDASSDIFQDSTEMEFSFDETPSSWFDSGSQFSERSIGDTSPSPTFQLFRLYSEQFCKSNFSEVLSGLDEEESSNGITWLKLEAEEHEESYQKMRKRERRQVYLHDYAREYCTNTDYGQLVIQQRLLMVHWMVEQSANKEFQRETMFLGVNLLDRLLSKGYFKSKRNLQIAGIACLALATRIEENQPFNSVRQKTFHIENNSYSRCEVVAMEWLVQEVLNFHCFLPTIYNFLWFYLKVAKADEEVEKTAKYLAVLALLGHEQLCYWPSTVAAGLVILSCTAAKKASSCHRITEIHSRSKDDNIPECMKSLQWLVKYIS